MEDADGPQYYEKGVVFAEKQRVEQKVVNKEDDAETEGENGNSIVAY